MTVTLGGCLVAAVAVTRSILPRSLRFLASHSSSELFQLTVLAFCLVSAWISGYLVRLTPACACSGCVLNGSLQASLSFGLALPRCVPAAQAHAAAACAERVSAMCLACCPDSCA